MINISRCRRGRGQPKKKKWNKVIRNYLKSVGIMENMTQDRSWWRYRIKVAKHKQGAYSPSFGFCLSSDYCSVVLAVIVSCMWCNPVGYEI